MTSHDPEQLPERQVPIPWQLIYLAVAAVFCLYVVALVVLQKAFT